MVHKKIITNQGVIYPKSNVLLLAFCVFSFDYLLSQVYSRACFIQFLILVRFIPFSCPANITDLSLSNTQIISSVFES